MSSVREYIEGANRAYGFQRDSRGEFQYYALADRGYGWVKDHLPWELVELMGELTINGALNVWVYGVWPDKSYGDASEHFYVHDITTNSRWYQGDFDDVEVAFWCKAFGVRYVPFGGDVLKDENGEVHVDAYMQGISQIYPAGANRPIAGVVLKDPRGGLELVRNPNAAE